MKMNQTLYNYDIYPKVFPVGREVTVTIKPQGKHVAFSGDYKVVIQRLDSGRDCYDFWKWNHVGRFWCS